MDITKTDLPAQPYLYVERSPGFTGPEISQAMGSGFGEIFSYLGQHGITPVSMPMAVYVDMPTGDTMKFRAGVLVSSEDAVKSGGTIKTGILPECEVLKATHFGSYANLNETHKALWAEAEKLGLTKKMPIWEIYVDDPTQVPEDRCRTDIYHAIG